MLDHNHGQATNVAATADVYSGSCTLLGFYVNNTNAGTIVFHDAISASAAITGTITPAIGFHELPVDFATGLRVVIGGTALDVTLFYKPYGA